ncbi:MAG: hypothetical protein COA49_00085 [Bacteroidetes bacterium]|nr:MAG: hypothetical protein COA49_00085 [Bacteroidota bacterium]
MDDIDHNLVAHYYGKVGIELERLKDEYKKISELTVADASKTSPLKPKQYQYKESPQKYYSQDKNSFASKVDASKIIAVINSLDDENRWLTTRAYISNPYIGDGVKTEPTLEYNSTRVADETDTSPYLNTTNQKYIVTGLYIRNMRTLINYLQNN